MDESSIDSASAPPLLVLLRPVAGGGGLVYEQVRELTHQGSSILSSTINRDIKYIRFVYLSITYQSIE